MDLRTQQNGGIKLQSPGRRSFLGALLALSTAAVTALLAAPLSTLRELSDTQVARLPLPGPTWGRCRTSLRSQCHGKDDYVGTPRAWHSTGSRNGSERAAGKRWAIPDSVTHLSASRLLGSLGGCCEGKFVCPCHSGSFTATGESRRTTTSLHGLARIQG